MSDSIDPQLLIPQVRVMQVIVLALAVGVLSFGAVVMVLPGGEPSDDPILSLTGVGLGFTMLVLGIAVPRRPVGSPGEAGVSDYQLRLIISCALLEGGAFYNLVAYMIERQNYSLAIAGILLVALLLQFPTVGRVAEWLDRTARAERESRAFDS